MKGEGEGCDVQLLNGMAPIGLSNGSSPPNLKSLTRALRLVYGAMSTRPSTGVCCLSSFAASRAPMPVPRL